MVRIQEFNHTALSVSDMDKSLAFYRDYLGLKVRSDKERAGELYDRLYGAEGVQLRSVLLETEPPREPTKRLLELIQWHFPPGRPFSMDACDQAFTWIGIPIRGLDTLYANQPSSLYHRFLSPPLRRSPTHVVAFCRDPDGTFVELTNNNHLNINTIDQERVFAFYRDTLGLNPATASPGPPGPPEPPEERQKALMTWFSLPRPKVDFWFLFADTQLEARNGRIDIAKWEYPVGRPLAEPLRLWDIGVKWPGLVVADLEAVYRELVSQGVSFVSPPVPGPSWKACICRDPEGNFVELVQRL